MKNIISLAKLDLALHDAFGLNQPMLNIIKQLKHKFKEDWSLNTQKDKKKSSKVEKERTHHLYIICFSNLSKFSIALCPVKNNFKG